MTSSLRYFFALCFGGVLLLQACNDKPVDRNSYESQRKNRELKVVSQVDIHTAALAKGQKLVGLAEQSLISNLQQALQDSASLAGALKYCNLAAMPLVDSLSKAEQVEIRRVSLKTRNKQNQPDSLEYLLLDSYAYSQQGGAELFDAVQEAEQGYLIYTKPIFTKNSLCLQCHGTPGTDMTVAHADLINSLYPADSAKGYPLGDLRGMWSVRLSVKEIVQGL